MTASLSQSREDFIPALEVLDIDTEIALPTPLQLAHTTLTGSVSVKARLVGPKDAPVILALGGISANRHVCDSLSGEAGWWQDFAGPGRVLDTQRYRILSFDFFPGDEHLGQAPVRITPQDQARIASVILNYFGLRKLHAFFGASYGGMVALSFAQLFPERVNCVAIVCAAHRPHPMGTAWRSIQRKIVRFGLETGQTDRGLSLARELGMTTYRTAGEFGARFAEENVEAYLENRGQAFLGRMSPARYLSLSESIDLHAVDPGAIPVPVTLVGFTYDQLVPIAEVRALHAQLPNAIGCYEHDSIYGHDAFLKEIDFLTDIFRRVLTRENAPEVRPGRTAPMPALVRPFAR